MRRKSRTARALTALACAALLATATAASAHHGQPATGEDEVGTLGAQNTGGQLSTDTYLTPVPKGDGAEKDDWQQVAGSRWQADGDITQMASPAPGLSSPTPYDLDFYGVDFLDVSIAMNAGHSREEAGRLAKINGFAVGARCRRDPANPSQPVPPDEVAGCKRIPVIYRYRDDRDRGLIWEESYPGDDATDPGGFVAAVTWLGPDRALAVGGTGTYPRREPERLAGELDDAYARRDACQDRELQPGEQCEGAGMARAWLFENGGWRELRNLPDGEQGDEIPDQMRAMQTTDASPRPRDCGPAVERECAIAGGMGQLWQFADGRFDFTASASGFRFRVRDIRFTPNWKWTILAGGDPVHTGASQPGRRAMAVTAGCCTEGFTGPGLLFLDAAGWTVPAGGGGSVVPTGTEPDSYYALTVWNADQGGVRRTALMTPGGPPERYAQGEPASRFTGIDLGRDPEAAVLGVSVPRPDKLSSLRLVSADGDLVGGKPNAFADWAVGVLRSSGQGVAFDVNGQATGHANGQATGLARPDSCTDDSATTEDDEDLLVPGSGIDTQTSDSKPGNQVPCSLAGYQRQNASKGIYALGSYALNAYRVAGQDAFTDDVGIGWAVGDHGAIATRGGGVAGTEAPPARSGAKSRPAPLPRGEAFSEHRPPVTSEPGAVPALAPGAIRTEPGFHDVQSAGGGVAKLIVMSRDGSEGWAFGSNASYHYDGLRWMHCNSADPACAGAPNDVSALSRVPLERDSDPRNDERFEAVAVTLTGIGGSTKSELYRYSGGRWARDEAFPAPPTITDEDRVKGVDVAFTAPDDGWAVRLESRVPGSFNVPAQTWARLYHFDGERWAGCSPEPQACGDDPARPRLAIKTPCPANAPLAGLEAAGERVYLYAVRDVGRSQGTSGADECNRDTGQKYPAILYHDRGAASWQGGRDTTADNTYNPTDGGWDPGCVSGSGAGCQATTPGASYQGRIASLSVAQDTGVGFQGWAVGTFGGTNRQSADAVMMRLSDGTDVPEAGEPGRSGWRPWTVPDAANEYLRAKGSEVATTQVLTLPDEVGRRNAFLSFPNAISTSLYGALVRGLTPALAFDQQHGRWAAIPTPWSVTPPTRDLDRTAGLLTAIAPDGQGGFWSQVAAHPGALSTRHLSFHHYTDRAPAPVFAETPDPTAGKARITAFDAGADGTVWLGDENGGVYRYDRMAGWSRRVEIPGWDPERASRRSAVRSIAVGPDGEAVGVGPGGRVAELGEQIELDPAATIGCDPQAPVPPCGKGSGLQATAVAPDGSAIVAGESRTLLWRPEGGDFRPITETEPDIPRATPIVDVSMPSPERAYLLTGTGYLNKPASRVIRGEMVAPGEWRWYFEIGDSEGSADPLLGGTRIDDIVLDASGHGYAVGPGGLLLQRGGDGTAPWRPLASGYTADLQSVALPAGGGEGALIGGDGGLLLTLVRGRFEVARHADPFDPVSGGIAGLGLTPGYATGEAEAWALRGNSLLHYPADPADARLDPSRGLTALADAPAPADGEISFAAFGKQDCDATRGVAFSAVRAPGAVSGARETCGPPDGSNITADLINRRIREELVARAADEATPQFVLFTGDAVDTPGGEPTEVPLEFLRTPLDANLKHRRWVELVADPLARQGLPTFGAIGGQDLARNLELCGFLIDSEFHGCATPSQAGVEQLGLQAGLNLPWRAAVSGQPAGIPAPWEAEQEAGGLRFERVGSGALSQRGPDADTPDLPPNGLTRPDSYPLDSGDTHYAVDVIDEATDEKVARIVVVDTSMRSLAASDPQQHPIEAGGQIRWLDEMTCFEGSAEDTDGDVRDCTREEGQQVIVLSNTPTYSYGPISPEETQTDAAAFEAILLKNQVNVVVSGRLGWNGRYWAVAPGVHAPCPGQGYRSDSEAPSLDQPEICGASGVGGTQGLVPDPGQVIQGLPEDAKQAAGLAGRGALPFVVSSSAGGTFNTKAVRGGFATAESGFWRGYSIVRLSPDGDPAKTIVEQRPILDWVGLGAHDPAVAPGQRLQLQSFAREAFGMDTAPRYYEIPETQVITHRYHLLAADPKQPWVAKQSADGPCAPYECLPENIGTIDPDTGEVRAGNGKYPDTFALATLSVGEHVAAQPLVFTKSPSFIVNPAGSLAEVPPPPTETGTASAPPPPPGSPTPPIPQASVPSPPPVPPIAPPQTAEPPEPQPPSPPVPPPPSEAPAPISLTLAPPSITVATPTAVIQPPTPPVNPAPPGGARREARQRQAAAQKSGADSDEEAPDIMEGGGDTAQGRPGTSAMTRHDHAFTQGSLDRVSGLAMPHRAGGAWRNGSRGVALQDLTPSARAWEPSFTPLPRSEPSAGAQALLYTGGIALLAAALTAGFTTLRPGPRRREPTAPSPAWSEARYRH